MANIDNCILIDPAPEHCKKRCGACGWNAKIARDRKAEIEANGLTQCPDGLRRLIIQKGAESDGNEQA